MQKYDGCQFYIDGHCNNLQCGTIANLERKELGRPELSKDKLPLCCVIPVGIHGVCPYKLKTNIK